MDELDEIWERMIREATLRAQAAGRSDVADYLLLKANNDAIRAASCRWLFDSFVELSDEANRRGVKLDVENENPHRFAFGKANLAGSLMCFRCGVRALTIEAGWTRAPLDGFMRGGALAGARISHFGMTRFNTELLLIRLEKDAPQWFAVEADGTRRLFSANDLKQHFQIFTGAL